MAVWTGLTALSAALALSFLGGRPPAASPRGNDAPGRESGPARPTAPASGVPRAPGASGSVPEPPRFAYRSVLFLGGGRPDFPSLDTFTKLAAMPDGGAFLLDPFHNRLVRFSPEGKVLLDLSGTSLGGTPGAVAPLSDGGFAVWLQGQRERVERFDTRGQKLAPLRLPAALPQIQYVGDLQLGPDGILYVLDYLPARIHRLRPGGEALPPLSIPQAKRTSFSGVQTRLAVSPDSLYLGGEGPELLRYRLDGTFAGRVPLPHWAEDIACDREGNLLIMVQRPTQDPVANPRTLYRISPKGRLLGAWEPVLGLAPGELAGLAQMSVASGDALFTLERPGPEAEVPGYAARLQKWVPAAPAPSPLRVVRDKTPLEPAPPAVLRRVLCTRLGKRLGRLTAPVADGAGRVYVGETLVDPSTQRGQTRVLRFTSQGRVVEALGQGSFKDQSGFPASVAAVAVDARTGELYAASDTEHLIRVFGPEGRVRRTIPLPGGFKNQSWVPKPLSLTFRPNGTLLLPDDQLSRLWILDSAVRDWHPFGNWGQGPAEFHMPVAVSAGGRGELYVADTMNRRVIRLDSDLQYQYEIRHAHDSPWDVAAAPDGGCVVGYDGAIARYDDSGRLVWYWPAPEMQSSFGVGRGSGGAHREGGLTITPDGTVYVTARLRDDDSNTPSYMLMVLGKRSPREAGVPRLRVVSERARDRFGRLKGTPGLEISTVAVTPLGLCIGPAIVRTDGTVVRTFAPRRTGGKPAASGMLAHIADACWTGRRLVLLEAPPKDTEGMMSLRVYDDQGQLAAVHPLPIHFGSLGWSLGGIPPERTPPQMAAWGQSVFVSSPNRGELLEYDLSGKVRQHLGAGVLTRPVGVAVSPGGEIYVADAARHRVEVFTRGGKHIRSLGGPGQAELLYPSSLAVGPNGTLYVLDQGAGEVLRLTLRGKLIGRSETIGGASLARVAVDRSGTVFLAGDRLRILRPRY
ncbi:MAG TPA: NHL repeat-containing protein [Armatimonadota bacterium]|nr:NHL repeat-containing protein [Armatimonadota bacterium]